MSYLIWVQAKHGRFFNAFPLCRHFLGPYMLALQNQNQFFRWFRTWSFQWKWFKRVWRRLFFVKLAWKCPFFAFSQKSSSLPSICKPLESSRRLKFYILRPCIGKLERTKFYIYIAITYGDIKSWNSPFFQAPFFPANFDSNYLCENCPRFMFLLFDLRERKKLYKMPKFCFFQENITGDIISQSCRKLKGTM